MAKLFGQPDPQIGTYVEELFQPEDDVLREIRARSDRHGLPVRHLSGMDARHLEVLIRAVAARTVVEVGTLAGYSAVVIARCLPAGGKLYTCEREPHHAEVARESFARAGVADRIEILEGTAIDSLAGLESEGPFDFVFIDADKPSYPGYLEWCERNLRRGGMLAADNTFGWGLIAASHIPDPYYRGMVESLRDFNRALAESPHFRGTILPTGEGLTVGVRI